MSVEIIFKHKAVKINDNEIFFLALYGSNNCFQTTYDRKGRRYERIARSWSPIYYNVGNKTSGMLFHKDTFEKELLDYQKEQFEISKCKDLKYEEQGKYSWKNNYKSIDEVLYSWMNGMYYKNKVTTYKQVINFVKHGFGPKTESLQDLLDRGMRFSCTDAVTKETTILTHDEIIEFLRIGKPFKFEQGYIEDIFEPKRTWKTKSVEYDYIDNCFVIFDGKGFLGKDTTRWTGINHCCLLFVSESEAKKYIEKNMDKRQLGNAKIIPTELRKPKRKTTYTY